MDCVKWLGVNVAESSHEFAKKLTKKCNKNHEPIMCTFGHFKVLKRDFIVAINTTIIILIVYIYFKLL